MRISQVAERSGLGVKTIRYYEEIGLVTPGRGDNGYREYANRDVQLLCFLQRARTLGFSIDECRLLLSLYQDSDRASADVRAIAASKISDIDEKIARLRALRADLSVLVEQCHGDDRPECPIMDNLAGTSIETAARSSAGERGR
jgi:Cu(I)-responsive transcriptional regulator